MGRCIVKHHVVIVLLKVDRSLAIELPDGGPGVIGVPFMPGQLHASGHGPRLVVIDIVTCLAMEVGTKLDHGIIDFKSPFGIVKIPEILAGGGGKGDREHLLL